MNPDRKVRGTVERGVADEAGNSFSPDAARKQTARSSSLHIKLCSWNNPTEDTRGRDRDFGEGNRAEVQELPRSVVLAPASLVVLWKGSDRVYDPHRPIVTVTSVPRDLRGSLSELPRGFVMFAPLPPEVCLPVIGDPRAF